MENGKHEKLLDAQIVAIRLGVSRTTVYQLMANGLLERRKVGLKKGYRVPESSLVNFINGNREIKD